MYFLKVLLVVYKMVKGTKKTRKYQKKNVTTTTEAKMDYKKHEGFLKPNWTAAKHLYFQSSVQIL